MNVHDLDCETEFVPEATAWTGCGCDYRRNKLADAWDLGFADGKRYAFEGVGGPKFHNPFQEKAAAWDKAVAECQTSSMMSPPTNPYEKEGV